MNEIKAENDEYNNNKILIQSMSYSKEGKLLLKNSEKDIIEGLNISKKDSKKEKNTARKKSDKVINNSNSNTLKKNKKIKNNRMLSDIIYNNNNKVFTHNSISFYPKKRSDRNDNNISDFNNISNYILLQKNTGKSLKEINLSKKKDKETISLSIDNINLNNTNDYKGNNPKFMINLNNILENNRRYINFSDNKIKLNNYINSSSKNYLSLFRYPLKLDKKCFICNCLNKKLFHAEKCKHLFCSNCGNKFSEVNDNITKILEVNNKSSVSNSVSNSNVHFHDESFHIHANSRSDFCCPNCGSENVQSLPIIYQSGSSGTSSVTQTAQFIGISQGNTMTDLARSVAPPQQKEEPAGCAICILLGIGSLFFGIIPAAIVFFVLAVIFYFPLAEVKKYRDEDATAHADLSSFCKNH